MLQYIDKPIEEMTIEELKDERRVHVWLARSMERIYHILVYKAENYDSTDYEEQMAQLKADYFDEVIDDDEFLKGRHHVRRMTASKERNVEMTMKKADYALMIAKTHRGFIAEINERIEELRFAEKPPKPRKLPKTYGYDPRKRRSKKNYPRDDWGHTRENHEAHKKRKGQA